MLDCLMLSRLLRMLCFVGFIVNLEADVPRA